MATDDRREHIFDLTEKFKFLRESKISRDLCGHNGSESSFCEKLGIARTTLLESVKADGLTPEQQGLLVEKCKFSLNWPEWNDPKALRSTKREDRRDTWEAFKTRYLEHHSKQEPQSSSPPATPVRLKEDLFAETLRGETEFASLSLRTGQSDPKPGEAMLGFDLNCPDVFADGITTGVKQGVLAFHLGYAHTTDVKDRKGYPDGIKFNEAKFTPQSVDRKNPSWLVTATGAAAIGLVGDAPPDFIGIMNLMAGASVSADFIACVRDIATTLCIARSPEAKRGQAKDQEALRSAKPSGGRGRDRESGSCRNQICCAGRLR
jgi:hypothetical protein